MTIRWKLSPSTTIGLIMGLVFFLSYASAHGAWTAPALIGLALLLGILLPHYSRWSNALETRCAHLTASVTAGRLARFAAQFLFNWAAFAGLAAGGVVGSGLDLLGGTAGAALIATGASQGAQYVGQFLARRGVGDPVRNTMLALAANIVATAFATLGVPWLATAYTVLATVLALVVFSVGILSDLRAVFYPQGGIAVFFGTFNPWHRMHGELVRQAILTRGVRKVIVHPTLTPRGHVVALAKGEIEIAGTENGYVVYRRGPHADTNVDYFPTGNRFLPPELRRDLIALGLADLERSDARLAGRTEVAWWPEAYEAGGFPAVLRHLRALHPDQPVHVIHGSDWGGMQVRSLLDDSGWFYPMAVRRRRDGVSATAIRAGAHDLTTPSVQRVLDRLAARILPSPATS